MIKGTIVKLSEEGLHYSDKMLKAGFVKVIK